MPDESKSQVIFIAGPTASGKSAAGLRLACEIGGEIVNADALQVYADLRILSARPSDEDEALAPHHLFGHVDGGTRYSAGKWARAAAAVIEEISARGRAAIVVGGTGLYFRALEDGLSEIPAAPEDIRKAARDRLAAIGNDAFHAVVARRDPAMAKLAPGDTQRLLRAYEVMEATGERLSAFQEAPRKPLIDAVAARIVIEPDRPVLYKRCEDRFDQMLAAGGLREAQQLAGRGLDPALPVMKALGAAELIAHLDGALSLEEAADLAKRNTRRFAKRQLTWFRNQAARWPRAANSIDAASFLKKM